MDQILINLKDPSWWFTGVFFILVGIFLTKFIFSWVPNTFKNVSGKVPIYGALLSRKLRLSRLKRIKRVRQHEILVNWEIAKFWSLATVTLLYSFFAVVIFLKSPKPENIGITYQIGTLIIFIPMYVLQIVTVWDKKVVMRIMKAHVRWKKNQVCSSTQVKWNT